MCITSKVYKNYVKNYDKDNKTKSDLDTFVINMPFSFRPLPSKLEDIIIDNSQVSHTLVIPVIDNIIEEKEKVKKALDYITKNILISYGYSLQQNISVSLVPEFLLEKAIQDVSKPVDMIISNVPGPRKALYYADSRINSILVTPQQGFFNNMMVILSYNEEFTISSVTNDLVGANLAEFIKMIVNEINDLIKVNTYDS